MNKKPHHTFDERVIEPQRSAMRIPSDSKLLGYSNVIVYEKDGQVHVDLSGGGFWPTEIKAHMNDPIIKSLRDFYLTYRKVQNKKYHAEIGNEFDY